MPHTILDIESTSCIGLVSAKRAGRDDSLKMSTETLNRYLSRYQGDNMVVGLNYCSQSGGNWSRDNPQVVTVWYKFSCRYLLGVSEESETKALCKMTRPESKLLGNHTRLRRASLR